MPKLKQLLSTGQTAMMENPGFASPGLVEYLGELGFEAVMLDCEHIASSVERIEEMARAARAAGISSIVRPEMLHEAIVTRYLDCKIDGIMVPHIHTAEEAQQIVDIVRYARPSTHQDTVIIAMIESVDGVNNLPKILAVKGIDAYFLARNDLSKTMGLGGDKNHPEVIKVVQQATKQILGAGKIVGGAGDWDQVDAVIAAGMKLIYLPGKMLLSQAAKIYRKRAGVG